MLAGACLLTIVAWRDLDYSRWHKLFATVMAAALVVSFALYRVIPRLGYAVRRLRKWRKG